MTAPSTVVRTVSVVDELTREKGTIVLVESGSDHRVVQLSPLAATVRELCRNGLSLDELATGLRAAFGEPPELDLATAVAQVVEELRDEGLVEVT